MNRRKRLDLLIICGFSFLILLIVAISYLGASGLKKTKTLFQQTYQRSYHEWIETEHANADLIAAHRAMKDVALSRSDAQLQAALNDFNSYDLKLQDYFAATSAAEQNNPILSDAMSAYADWAPIRARTIDLAISGQYELAAENTRAVGSSQVTLIRGKMQLLIEQQKEKADAAFKNAEETSTISIRFLVWMTILAVVSATLLSLYIRRRLLRFQALLHEEKQKFQITLDSIGDGIIATDTNGNVLGLNRVAEELTGWTALSAPGKSFNQVFNITNAYTGEVAKDPVEEVLTTDKICLLENHTILTSKDGTKRHIADSAAPIKDEYGQTSGVVMIFRDVTEKKLAEKLLKESEEKFRTIFEQSPIGIGLSDPATGQILDMNDRLTKILGRSREELKIINWAKLTHPDDQQDDLEQIAQLNAGKISNYHIQKRYTKPDSSSVWVEMSVALVSNTDHINPLHLCMLEDITQQKLAENELRISENRLKTAQTIANIGNWEIDLNARQVWASEQALVIYGIKPYTPIVPLGVVQDLVCTQDRPMTVQAFRALWAENTPYNVQFTINRADDNAKRIIHSHAVVERDSNGNPLKAIGIIQDITELKHAELALAQSNIRLEATLQSTADGIEALDLEGNRIFYNEQFKKMWGLPADITKQNTSFDYVTNQLANPNKTLGNVHAFLKQMQTEPFRELSLKDGRTLERYAKPILVDGIITGYVLSFRDISERKCTEQALLSSETKHRSMIANISDSIIIIDKDGYIVYTSPNLENLFGWSREDFADKRLSAFVHPDDIEILYDVYFDLSKENIAKASLEYRLRCKDALYRYIHATAVDMMNDPNIQGILMNFHDISDNKRREDEILYLNYHDLLTGLYNRAFFEEECSRLDTERQLPISVIMGDINGLKLINDAFGHNAGDKLLVEIAKILSNSCRKEDILARTGGDEFCILLPQTTTKEARTICQRIGDDCKLYNSRTDKETFHLSISLGYATKIDHEVPITRILTLAEEYMYKQKLLERKSMHSSIISSIRSTMIEKSHSTAKHEERLAALSMHIGKALNLTARQLNELELLSTLHGIGKLNINDKILNKPGKLTDEEWVEIRKHPDMGYRIAQTSPELIPIADYILYRHERWDGKGYPQGLKGDNIPLLSRIVAVVDAFDAMTQDRPYRKAMTEADAINEILSNAGTQFDPEIAKIFVNILTHSF